MNISTMDLCARRRLPAAIAAIFSLASSAALGNTVTVSNCNDAGAGSLRAAAAAAVNNDTIDMTALSCSVVSLHTGAITLPQTNITLNGPGQGNLLISGKYQGNVQLDRVIKHTGTGDLAINNLTIGKGYLKQASGNAPGGCIYSAGTATLAHVGVYGCKTYTAANGRAQGGGVFGKGGVTLKYSTVSGNKANGGSLVGAYGGGVYSKGTFAAKYSTIDANTAGDARGFGGGVLAYASSSMLAATISGNKAGTNGGGLYTHNFFDSANVTTTIENSTISGNSAGIYTGGIGVNSGKLRMYNSTIVLNTATKGRGGGSYPFTYRAPGLATYDGQGPMAVTLQANLIANNTYGSPTPSNEYDVSVPKRSSTTVAFSGSHNLVRSTFAAVPADTMKIACPLLGPLRNNGGLTETHALLSGSPGIDQGNNTKNLANDQRGPPYARVDNAVADIGAYEVQHSDIVFNNGFDGCPVLF